MKRETGRRVMQTKRYWLDYDPVALAVLVIGIGAIELLLLSISLPALCYHSRRGAFGLFDYRPRQARRGRISRRFTRSSRRQAGRSSREPARDLGPGLAQRGCPHEQPEMRASRDLRAELLAADRMSGGEQLFGGDDLGVAGR